MTRRRSRAGAPPVAVSAPACCTFVGTLLTLFIWLAFFELAARLWGVSLAKLVEENVAARGIAHAVMAIIATFFIAWLLWILIDTAIKEALNPERAAQQIARPSMRARTMLPLVRNVRVRVDL